MQVPVDSDIFFTLQTRLRFTRTYMTGQIADLETEITLAWEQLAQLMQKALKYHNIRRMVRVGRELEPEFLPPTIVFGDYHYNIDQETQCKFLY